MSRVPVVVRVANCADVSMRHPAAKARLALTKPGHYGLPDVVLFSEVSTVDLRVLAKDWDVLQKGAVGSASAGTALATRCATARRAHQSRYVVGSPATGEGGGIRERGIVSDRVRVKGSRSIRAWSGHAPPPRAPRARLRFLATSRLLLGVFGGDLNTPSPLLRRRVTRKVRAVGVLGLLVPRWIPCSPPAPVDIKSDHPSVDVVLYLPARKRRKKP